MNVHFFSGDFIYDDLFDIFVLRHIRLGRMNFERTAVKSHKQQQQPNRTKSISSRRKNPTRILNFLLLVLLFVSFVFFFFFRLPGFVLSNFRVYLSLADVSLTSAHAIRRA